MGCRFRLLATACGSSPLLSRAAMAWPWAGSRTGSCTSERFSGEVRVSFSKSKRFCTSAGSAGRVWASLALEKAATVKVRASGRISWSA